MSNTGTSSIIATGFGIQTQPNPLLNPRPPTYNDYLLAAIHDVSTRTFTYRDTDEFPEAGRQLIRLSPSAYGDNLNTPSGSDRPSARLISNIVFDQPDNTTVPNPKKCTDMFWLWGQFIDHDLDLTPDVGESFNISVPTGDEYFDPNSTGNVYISLHRSVFDPETGTGMTPREQVNKITQEIDASSIYGSTTARATWLRSYKDGKLKEGMGRMLPINDGTLTNAGPNGSNMFVSGDIRANENIALLSMHTLFMREHNWWANKIKKDQPNMSDEEIYQRARIMVESEIQAITFKEFLPLLLGPDAIPVYTDYDSEIENQIATEFSSCAFRLGHSLLSETLLRLNKDNQSIGNLQLREAFFAPDHYANDGDIDYILRGFCKQICQKLDNKLVNSIRNFLFGQPGSGGLDLASLNIQRARDHGIPDYNTVRNALGLAVKSTFNEISSDANVAAALSSAYGGDISKVDLWVGGLCEDPIEGSQLGEVFHHIVSDQFTRTRNGDVHWYQRRISPNMVKLVNRTKLSQIIKRNTKIKNIQNEVMHLN